MENKKLIEKKFAKIVISTEYVMRGKVLEITPTHHLIQDENGKVMEVKNDRILKVEVLKTQTFEGA